MTRFTEEQKRIAMLLMYGSKTAEELNKQLDIPYDKLMQELSGLLKLDVIVKEGYPTKYKLKENISQEVKRRKRISEDDSFKLRLNAFIEMQAIEKTLLEHQLSKMEIALNKEKDFTIYSVEKAEITKEDEYYSSYLEINLTVRDFTTLMHFVMFYAPASLEIIKPEKMEFTAHDLQDGLIDLSEMLHKYTEYVTKLMNREELERFHRNIFKK
ncbi:MAG: hypothetical protein V1672_03750 [Candidatus Diapherotrites archaeon]